MARKILIVDDEPDLLKVATFRLKKAGYEIINAVNGKEAIELTQQNMPDLILLDLILPSIRGDEVCRQLKNNDKLQHIPVLLFTASTMDDLSAKVKEVGADGYLTKPFELEDLLSKVKRLIG
ncbi:MAG: response regulator [Candidatus Omnitrophota bacterium]